MSGAHTTVSQDGVKISFILFIFREVIFFFSIFWVFFDASLSPSAEIGGMWPPLGITCIDCGGTPLLGTLVLISRGAAVTWAHSALLSRNSSFLRFSLTVLLGVRFMFIQGYEYLSLPFTTSDSIYRSVFYFSTGFHGLHVLLGSLFMMLISFRLFASHFSSDRHLGLEFSILYWHFVDVVWIFLFVFVYWWGGGISSSSVFSLNYRTCGC